MFLIFHTSLGVLIYGVSSLITDPENWQKKSRVEANERAVEADKNKAPGLDKSKPVPQLPGKEVQEDVEIIDTDYDYECWLKKVYKSA